MGKEEPPKQETQTVEPLGTVEPGTLGHQVLAKMVEQSGAAMRATNPNDTPPASA